MKGLVLKKVITITMMIMTTNTDIIPLIALIIFFIIGWGIDKLDTKFPNKNEE